MHVISPPYPIGGPPPRHGPHRSGPQSDSTTGRRARQADVRSREGPFVSDTTDLMGVTADSRCRHRHAPPRLPRRRLPAPPLRHRPRRHGPGRAAAGRVRPRHQGHRADAQEPADRGHQGGAGRRRRPQGRGRRRPPTPPRPSRSAAPPRKARTGDEPPAESAPQGREGRRPAADRDPRPAGQRRRARPASAAAAVPPPPPAARRPSAAEAVQVEPKAETVPPAPRSPRPRPRPPRRSPARRRARTARAAAVATAATAVTAASAATAARPRRGARPSQGGDRGQGGQGRAARAAAVRTAPGPPAAGRPRQGQQARAVRTASATTARRTTTTTSGGRRGRRGRYRDRRGRRGRDEFAPSEPQVADDDVLIPVAGILDILDNYAFIRTSGYLPGPNDVYVSLAQVRKNGLRKGDHVTGAVRQPKDGERREKFNALVRLDSVERHGARIRPRPPGVQQADPALPAGPAPSGDRPGRADHPHHRPRRRRSARASAV